MTRFRPRLSARIDTQREAIELSIVNKGRASGIIELVQIVRTDTTIVEDVEFDSFPAGAYRPLSLPAMAAMKIIIQSPAKASFDPGVQVIVGVGSSKPKFIIPAEAPAELGIYGLRSVLPPGTSRILQREAQEQAQLPSGGGPAGQHRG